MKKNKGNALIIIAIVVVVIIILGIIGYFVYEYLNSEKNNQNLYNNEFVEQNEYSNIDTSNNQGENTGILTPILNEIKEENNTESGQIGQTIAAAYYYGQLDSYGKVIYNKIKQDKERLKTGTYIFDFGTEVNTLLKAKDGKTTLNTSFQSAWNALSYDEDDLFYIDVSKMSLTSESRSLGGITTYYVSIGPGNNKNYLKEDFQTQDSIEKAQNYIDNLVNQVVEQTKNDATDIKIKRIHNWLISTIQYEKDENSKNQHNIYGALHDKKAVCEGYARSFKYIMKKVGVPAVLVSGTARNSEDKTESHAWNYVQINENWYAVDVTWDDPIITEERPLSIEEKYRYCLKGSDEFFKDHTEDGMISENGMKFKYPTLSKSNYE